MRTIIAGSRQLGRDHPPIYYVGEAMVLAKKAGIVPTEIVSGGARGVDLAGEEWAAEQNLPVKKFLPDWSKGKRAGLDRNIEMAEYAQALVAVWDGRSTGTAHMISRARGLGLLVYVHNLEAYYGHS